MSTATVAFAVFTKPWTMPLRDLGRFIKGLGFDSVELPIRPGYQVEPANVSKGLPEAAKILADYGLKITSVAGPTDQQTIEACAQAGVPLVRICVKFPADKDYFAAVAEHQRQWASLIPHLDRNGVAIGVQNHADRFIANAAQLRHAVAQFDPKHVAIVWDAAHNALQGEDVDIALDTVWSHLRLVNLKNAYWKLETGPEAPAAKWSHYWTTGRHGLANWPWVARELKKRQYRGDICLTAEYTDTQAVDRLIAEDIAFARELFSAS